ncbi:MULTISPECIES: metal ABC transporter solute-binding protein, Zn/Mn family [unclassified Pseudomonas]|uniref:metal ABC transporter substrate-binding protein n=1 Tax=unclassified Pseudomonas TaxID=196821 RepID=UPI000C88EFDD|nr:MULTISPECIES: zinc ABC transporter substrate-binding protein [unclassified Pseudomonas]PMZ86695.1 metal ABC transporter substrate-binding protein [Pseudomonas sp. FW215-T2]PNA08855.1 metal ABC transporter substrate-binding protein [Pseudomonas sp. FW215-R3]PNB35379.1 metal ABC transporter substrate-binding protein [Pseudomonas sp. FW305-131]
MIFSLRQLTLAIALCGLATTTMAADIGKPLRVLTSLPITYGLGEVLLKGTDVSLERAAPANLPGSRQTAYFTGRGAPALAKLASDADAVIGLRSLWPDDPLYPIARRSNIRIVEVDAARPVDGALPGIAVQPDNKVDGLNSQPWFSSNNMGRMADVMAADLVRLAPEAKPKIDANLAALKQRLLKLSADSEARLANVDNLSVMSLSDHFGYLIGGLNLELIGQDARADAEWTPEALKQLGATLKDNDVTVVLHHRQPSDALKAVIAGSGSRLVVLSTDAEDPVAELEGNVDLLIKGLNGA